MTDQPTQTSLAGKKGGAVRAAKAKARESGEPVALDEWGIVIFPDGHQEAIAEDGKADPRADQTDAPDGDPSAPVPGRDYTDPDFAEVEEATEAASLPNTILGRANYYVTHNGLSEADALALAQMQLGGGAADRGPAPPRGPEQGATPGDAETMGPDPALVDAYNERMKTYVAPKLDVKVTVENPNGGVWEGTIKLSFLDYLQRSAAFETIKRGREVNPADRLQMILREHKRDNQDAALLMNPNASTGPAGAFDEKQAGWS